MGVMLLIFCAGGLLSGSSSFALTPPPKQRSLGIRGGGAVETNAIAEAAGWMIGMRTPATLVAGSALSSFMAFSGELACDKSDPFVVKALKRWCLVLLFSSFFFEVFVIFAGTVTSTWLLAVGDDDASKVSHTAVINPMASSVMGFLHRELEFEYVTIRLFFLQGLLCWLSGVAFKFLLPSFNPETPKADKELAKFYSRGLVALVLMMVHYFQRHQNFYKSYFHMCARFAVLLAHRLRDQLPLRNPVLVAALLCTAWTLAAFVNAVKADFDEVTALPPASPPSSKKHAA